MHVLGLYETEEMELAFLSLLGTKDKLINARVYRWPKQRKLVLGLRRKNNHTPSCYQLSKKRRKKIKWQKGPESHWSANRFYAPEVQKPGPAGNSQPHG